MNFYSFRDLENLKAKVIADIGALRKSEPRKEFVASLGVIFPNKDGVSVTLCFSDGNVYSWTYLDHADKGEVEWDLTTMNKK